jgi:hypothetical protein
MNRLLSKPKKGRSTASGFETTNSQAGALTSQELQHF